MSIRKTLAAALVAAIPTAGLAAGGGGHVTDVDFSFEGPLGSFDNSCNRHSLRPSSLRAGPSRPALPEIQDVPTAPLPLPALRRPR